MAQYGAFAETLFRRGLLGHVEFRENRCALEKDGDMMGGSRTWYLFAFIEGMQCATSILGALTVAPAGKMTFTFLR